MYKSRDKVTPAQNPRQTCTLRQYACENKDIPLKKQWAERWCTLLAAFGDTGFMEELLQMEVRQEDVFVISFMKCGTTWMLETAWLLMNNLNYEKARKLHIDERCPFLEWVERCFKNTLFCLKQILKAFRH